MTVDVHQTLGATGTRLNTAVQNQRIKDKISRCDEIEILGGLTASGDVAGVDVALLQVDPGRPQAVRLLTVGTVARGSPGVPATGARTCGRERGEGERALCVRVCVRV